MICVSLAEESLNGCLSALKEIEFAEIRLDRMGPTLQDVWTLFSSHGQLIATCRPGRFTDDDRKVLLLAAIRAGAAYVDVEIESEPSYREEIIVDAKSRGCKVIVSFHDYEKTPGRAELEAILSQCFLAGADIAKIACTALSQRDSARLLGLLDREEKVVVVAMGERGRITRIVAPLFGSPFAFASLRPGKETAEGQIDRATLEGLIQTLQRARAEGACL
jgi:3-dehydroquinate dehydratase-1